MSNATPQRVIRMTDELWEAAKVKAAAEGTNVSEKVRAFLAEDVAA
jgi:predicted DNA binding CopG/RHH family protein